MTDSCKDIARAGNVSHSRNSQVPWCIWEYLKCNCNHSRCTGMNSCGLKDQRSGLFLHYTRCIVHSWGFMIPNCHSHLLPRPYVGTYLPPPSIQKDLTRFFLSLFLWKHIFHMNIFCFEREYTVHESKMLLKVLVCLGGRGVRNIASMLIILLGAGR